MMTLLALIISFAVGVTIGLQLKHIVDGLYATIRTLNISEKKRNVGVVRPPISTPAVPEHRSAVVRPRVPKETDTNETDQALASVRNRTATR